MSIGIELEDRVNSALQGAAISIDKKYRYLLWRTLGGTNKSVAFVMCNPSLADDGSDDPTIRRCIGFCKALGYDRLFVINLFNYITPYPAALRTAKNPVGDELAFNAAVLDYLIRENCHFVCAWGASADFNGRAEELLKYLSERTKNIFCLGKNKDGTPKHPLYLPKNSTLKTFTESEAGK